MPTFLLTLLKPLGNFLKSKTFIISLGVAVAFYMGLHYLNNYVKHEVNQQVQITRTEQENTDLKRQVQVLEQNNKVVDDINSRSKPIYEAQTNKSKKIEDNINDEVKKGNDGFTGSILTNTIDGL